IAERYAGVRPAGRLVGPADGRVHAAAERWAGGGVRARVAPEAAGDPGAAARAVVERTAVAVAAARDGVAAGARRDAAAAASRLRVELCAAAVALDRTRGRDAAAGGEVAAQRGAGAAQRARGDHGAVVDADAREGGAAVRPLTGVVPVVAGGAEVGEVG